LSLYDHEQDGETKTQAAISYHTRLRALGHDTQSAVQTLSRNIACVGSDYMERRQAAFCGLVTLGRLDVLLNAKERGDKQHCAISITESFSPNTPLLRHILHNWDAIKAALGSEFWLRLERSHSDPLYLWDALCMFADEYPAPRDEAIRFLEERPERTAMSNILRFLGRARPKSSLLLEYCLKALGGEETPISRSGQEVDIAAELVGAHFGGDSEVLARVMSVRPLEALHEGMLLALCEGWPESADLERMFEIVCSKQPRMTYAT